MNGQRRRIGLLLCWLVAVGTGVSEAGRDHYSMRDVVSPIRSPEPQTTPPPLNADDYRAFAQPGTGTVWGIPFVKLRNGYVLQPRPGDYNSRLAYAYLYPDTPYTRWMINQWSVDLMQNRGDPSTPASDTRSPSWLEPAWRKRGPTVVQTDSIEGPYLGGVLFENVPSGSYILTAKVYTGEFQPTCGSVDVSSYIMGGDIWDGFLVTAYVQAQAHRTVQIPLDAFATAAHLHQGQ